MSVVFEDFELDQERRQLLRAGEPVPLEPKAYELLTLLVERRPKALSRAQIRDVVWPQTFISESTLAVTVNAIRQALGDDARQPRFIRTVHGFGYAFCGEAPEGSEGQETARIGEDSRHSPGRPAFTEMEASAGNVAALEAASKGLATTAWEGELGRRRWPRRGSLAAFVALLGGTALWLLVSRGNPSKAVPAATVVPLTNLLGLEDCPALSPEGSRVAFSWNGETANNWDIYVKQIGTEALLRLTRDAGDDGAPAWSPDGGHIAFSRQTEAERAYFVVPALGGPARRLHTVSGPGSRPGAIDWSPDGRSLALEDSPADGPQRIVLLSIETLEAIPLLAVSGRVRLLAFSPDGRYLAFAMQSATSNQDNDIYVLPTSGGEPRRLTFDSRWVGGLAWTRNGREIVFSSFRAGPLGGLWRVAASGGAPEPVTPGGEGAGWVSIARGADRLAYTRTVLDLNIWKVDVDESARRGGRAAPIGASTAVELEPQFSPDGSRIAFRSDRSGYSEIWACQADGSACAQLSSLGGPSCGAPRWSPDGSEIAFDGRPEGNWDVFVVDIETHIARPLTRNSSDDVQPSWSRDGRWLYFGSNRSGSWQIWKTPAAGGQVFQVTTGGGWRARESPDGAVLYFGRTFPGGDIWRRRVAGEEESPILQVPNGYWWDVGEPGLYYLNTRAQPRPAIELYDPDTGDVTRVVELQGDPNLGDSGLAVSPDGRSILYSRVDTAAEDLMLIEHFR